MKAIIPVAGAGTTLRPHTHTHPKPLIPVAGKPILGHIIEGLLAADINDFVFVIGHLGEKIREFVDGFCKGRFSFAFVAQSPRLGLAHAVALCKAEVDPSQPVLIALGDTIIEMDLQALLANPETVLAVQEVDQPWEYGVAVVNEGGLITSLVEKPSIPKSNLALVGLYKIANAGSLMAAAEAIIHENLRTRGEFQLTDALMEMVRRGERMRTALVNKWYNCGRKDVLLETNRQLLQKMPQQPLRQHPDSIIIPPVFIPANVEIGHSIVGPFVAVGEHARILNSIVQDSILGEYSTLEGIMLKESVVGNDSKLVGRWHAINIGDNTEIDFNH